MNGVWMFLLPVFSIIPLVPAFFWFRHKKYGYARFFLAAGLGVLTVPAAGFLQLLFPRELPHQSDFVNLLFGVFVRISLVEEAVRAASLFLLFRLIPQSRIEFRGADQWQPPAELAEAATVGRKKVPFFGAPSGLVAGLGFAAGESVFYSLADFRVVFFRMVTAAPLHAACGARLGHAFGSFQGQPVFALFLLVTAFIIHSIYNLSVLNPQVPRFLSVVIALAAFGSSIVSIRFGNFDAQKKEKI